MSVKRVGVLVEYDYEELEVWYPLLRFREEGMKTFTIAPQQGTIYKSKKGYPCTSDFDPTQVNAEELDALICPGGWCPDYLRRDKRIVNLVRDMVISGKTVGAVCHGLWMLCSAKVLKDRKVTCFHAIRDDVENAGASYEDASVVVDGNLVTSRIPSDLPDFCKAILEQLK